MKVTHRFHYDILVLVWIFLLFTVASVWAAPGCVDSDGDGESKFHRKWCDSGVDPDDNDPCIPDPLNSACSTGGGGDDIAPDPYNLARASFASPEELGWSETNRGGVFADGEDGGLCPPYDYWDWQEELLPDSVGLDCHQFQNSSNVSGGGRWFLISSPAGSDVVVDKVERYLRVDFGRSDDGFPCLNLDDDDGLYLKQPDQIDEDNDTCWDHFSVRLAADRMLKMKANQQQLEISLRHRPNPSESIYWPPWGYIDYINPLYLREPETGDPSDWVGCRIMSTRASPTAHHDRAEAELLMETGPGQTEVLGTYHLPMEVCVSRASD